MVDVEPQLQDHAVGLEMQIVELARQADQAAHDGWPDREAALRKELEGLYSELASVAERLTTDTATPQSASFVDPPPAREDPTG